MTRPHLSLWPEYCQCPRRGVAYETQHPGNHHLHDLSCSRRLRRDAAVTGGPSAFKNELGLVAIGSPVLDWSIPRPCSPVGPVPVPFTLHVTTGASPITLSEVRFQAMDASRSIAPPTIFDASSLTRQFGSITVAGFGVRHFPFTYPFRLHRGWHDCADIGHHHRHWRRLTRANDAGSRVLKADAASITRNRRWLTGTARLSSM